MSGGWLPWSDSCFVCGEANRGGLRVRFRRDGDEVVVETSVAPQFEGYPGRVHGGVVTALLDETAGWACTVHTGRLYFTAELTVRFRAPVPGGTPLLVRGRMISARSRMAEGEARIEGPGGEVLAECRGRYVAIPRTVQDEIVPRLKMGCRPAAPQDLAGGEPAV